MSNDPLENPQTGRSGRAAARRMLAILAAIAFLAVAGAVFWLSEQQARKMQVGIPDFTSQDFRLTDQSGATRTAADFAGAPVALFFGYTYCPDVCPMTLTLLANALDEVAARGLDTAPLQTIFVTVDAERDTPEQLAAYLSLFDTEVTGLTGSAAELADVQQNFGAYAARVKGDDGVVLWDHTATVYLYDAGGGFTGTIVFNEPPEFVTEKLARLFAAG
ncbi:MAG: SCO family protein [Pseudomonadota bacterium]|nr:SCO family protein [Pseudomonadota bacterium]